MSLDAGQRIGPYELRRPLGNGETGQVWSAILHGAHGFRRLVALKVLSGGIGAAQQRAFLREARLRGLVHHPNVVSALDVGEADGRGYVAMELVRGVPTNALQGRLGPSALIDLAIQACAGLQHLHDLTDIDGEPLGLVHRDVKPANIMVDAAGMVRLLDFGIARLAAQPGELAGTVGYMAPEQLDGEGRPSTDVFSLALVLVRLATGLEPLGGSTAKLARVARAMEDPALRVALDDVAPGLGSVIGTAVRQDPDERYPSARAFAEALRRLRVPAGAPLAQAVVSALPKEDLLALQPTPCTPVGIVGRDRALAAVSERLRPGAVVVVAGPAGVGKSTLVDAVASALPMPSVRCDLEGARDGEGVVVALAAALELRGVLDVPQLAIALAARGPVALVLDGVERRVGAVAEVLGELLPQAPEARVLCASRVTVPLPGAVEAKLGPLAVGAARQLLRERCSAELSNGQVNAVLERVGRLPLAVELAAAMIDAEGVDGLLASLEAEGLKRLDALEQAIRVSWEQLPADARDDLTRLAAFVGPFPMDAAAAVLPLAGSPVQRVERLARGSMLQVRKGRFRLLPSIRAFVSRYGDPGARAAGEQAHGRWVARLGERALVTDRAIGIEHALALRAHLDELLAAYERARARGDAEVAVACAIAASQPLMAQGRPGLALDRVDGALVHRQRVPELLNRRGLALCALGRAAEAEQALRDAHVRCSDPVEAGRYARVRSVALRALGRTRDAIELLEAAFPAQDLAGDARFADTVGELGRCLLATGRPWEAEAFLSRAVEGSRRDINHHAYRSSQSVVHMFMGNFDEAIQGLVGALEDQEDLGLLTTSFGARAALAVCCWLSGRPKEALAAAERLLDDASRIGRLDDQIAGHVLLAHARLALGDVEGAVAPAEAAVDALPSLEHRRACEVWMVRAAVCWAQRRPDDARALAAEAPDVPRTLGWESTLADQALQLARYGLPDAAEQRLAPLEDVRNPWRYAVTSTHLARAFIARARGRSMDLTACDEALRSMQWGSQEAPLLRVRRHLG